MDTHIYGKIRREYGGKHKASQKIEKVLQVRRTEYFHKSSAFSPGGSIKRKYKSQRHQTRKFSIR